MANDTESKTPAYMADEATRQLLIAWDVRATAAKEALDAEAAAGAAFQRHLDAMVGPGNAAVIIAHVGRETLKAGRIGTSRGGGLNKGRILSWLREMTPSRKALYKKFVVEEKVIEYHINTDALMAAAALDESLMAAVLDATDKGTPGISTVRPQKAGNDLVASATAWPR